MKKLTSAMTLAVAALLHANAFAGVAVAPDDKNLQYTGRVDVSKPGAPSISWPNTAIAGNFTGTSLAITLDDEKGKNYFNVFFDGDTATPLILEAAQGSKTYQLGVGLAPGKHSFLITKRTEGEEGATVVQGFELADGGRMLPPSARPTRHIEFFGDSITSGMGDEGPMNGRDDVSRDKNSFLSYAGLTARALNAELHQTSQSGIGVMISWFPFTMPDFYDQLNAVGNNDSHWDFKRWTPDVVVINLLQNDFWLIGRDHKLKPEPTEADIVAHYEQFVRRIRQLYPHATIVCALGSMDATQKGSAWPGYIETAVAHMRQGGDKRIDTVFFPYTGYGQHPRLKQQKENAEKLTAFIRQKMGW
jgi:lysophospholipase L1-like esterase